MNSEKYATDLWQRAEEALRTAEADLTVSFDAVASRAYYAVFYAVSALFTLEGKEARDAVSTARRIRDAVIQACPELAHFGKTA